MLNKAMERKIKRGDAIDLKDCKREPRPGSSLGYYVIDKPWESISDLDFCDSVLEYWIWSIGRRKSDGVILASLDSELYQNPDFDCLFLR